MSAAVVSLHAERDLADALHDALAVATGEVVHEGDSCPTRLAPDRRDVLGCSACRLVFAAEVTLARAVTR